jgi:hypothetical protein
MPYSLITKTFVAWSLVATALPALAETQSPLDGAQARSPFTLAVIGDAPYGAAQFSDFPALIDDINADNKVRMVVHVGDIKNGSSRCDTSYFDSILSAFNTFADPIAYTPGDNEWTDCHRSNNGKYDPLDRLAEIRSTFYAAADQTLGQQPKVVYTQSSVAGFETFVENQMWMRSQVVFSTVHAVGSNNGLAVWFGDDLTDAFADDPIRRQQEVSGRVDAAVDWIDRTFALATEQNAAAVAIFMQADTFRGAAQTGFTEIVQELAEEALVFGRPVLLLQGDSHVFLVDKPLENGHAGYSVDFAVPNVTRLVVEGETTSEWLKLEIDPRSADVFSWTRIAR